MRDYLTIGSSPCGESCSQLGSSDYDRLSQVECTAFKHQLERLFPSGSFRVKAFPHDFGWYKEVVAFFDTDALEDDPMTNAAFQAEGNGPEKWDDEALTELKENAPDYFEKVKRI